MSAAHFLAELAQLLAAFIASSNLVLLRAGLAARIVAVCGGKGGAT